MKNISSDCGVLQINKKKYSEDGNPQYFCTLIVNGTETRPASQQLGVTFRTMANSHHGYSVSNYEGKRVSVAIGTHYGVPTLAFIKPLSITD